MNNLKYFLLSFFFLNGALLHAQDNPALMTRLKEMHEETDPGKSIGMMNKAIAEFKLQAGKDAETIDMMKGDVAMDYLNNGNYAAFEKYVGSIRGKFNQTSYLNMGAATLVEKKKDLGVAERLAKKTLTLYNGYKDDPKARPESMSKDDWARFMKFAYYPYCDTYASVLYALGKNKEALVYQEKALNGSVEDAMPQSAERYASLLSVNGRQNEAYELVLKMASTGKSTVGMNKLLKELYVKKYNNEAGFEPFFDSLQVNVVASLKENLKKKMQNTEVPGFTLKDTEGKTVSLTDFKGKTVVIDFWATWCMPCKASFPAMTKVMKQHPEVTFLYIATQEKQDGALNRVKNYISQNNYPFHVLMDEPLESDARQFKALSLFKPEGIPAKVIIDAKGNQRFLSIGFSSDTELINELEAMIQLAKELS